MKKNKLLKYLAGSSTAIVLTIMLVISCFSVIAVNKNETNSGASVNVKTVGNKLAQ